MILDRDTKFDADVLNMLRSIGMKPKRTSRDFFAIRFANNPSEIDWEGRPSKFVPKKSRQAQLGIKLLF